MKILLSGSHGLIGSALKQHLEKLGHAVIALSRDLSAPIDFTGVDAVIHLAGESIAEGRWNAEKKNRIEESRVVGTLNLSRQIAASTEKPAVFISASAIGYYGNRGSDFMDESSDPGCGFLSEVCKKWEDSTRPAAEAGVRTVNIRTGIVLSTSGGALKQMLPPFRFGFGGILGNGRQYMSWISMDDMIQIFMFILNDKTFTGPVNLVSPHTETNREFTRILGKILHRPTLVPLPAFAARILFGEMADALLLSSTRVVPQKLLKAGYRFKHDTLHSALKDLLE